MSAWIISDGKAGHEAQSLGVAAALALKPEIKRVSPSRAFAWTAPWGPVSPSERFGRDGSQFAPPWPQIAIAAGRATVPYLRALKRQSGVQTFAVMLMDPRTGANTADLIWVPEHDKLEGANVLRTLAAPHGYSAERLAALRAQSHEIISKLESPKVGVLIGGPNRDFQYNARDQARLVAALRDVARITSGLMVTPSRRTPTALINGVRDAISGTGAFIWDGVGENPYPAILAHADHFIVTADSVSMICEAAATGRPIHVFEPEGMGAKFQAFHNALQARGVTRALAEPLTSLETWTYAPLDSARLIADEIERRLTCRADWLAGTIAQGRVERGT